MIMNLSDKLRFEEKYNPFAGGGCWEWTAGCVNTGYGQFWVGGKSMRAHRASWLINVGDIPADKMVLHKCHNRKCINPEHLYLGDHQQNMDDRNNSGRTNKWDKRYNFKRNDPLVEKVISLYSSDKKILEICEELQIAKTTYYRIRSMPGFPKENYRITARVSA